MKKRVIGKSVIIILILLSGLIGALFISRLNLTGLVILESSSEKGQTVILKGENLGDSYVKKGNQNFGSKDELLIRGGNSKHRTYLKFNISSIPEKQIIDSSELCLYLYKDQAAQKISVYQVYTDWNEKSLNATQGITWENQPCGKNLDNSTACNLTAEDILSNDGTYDNTWQCWNITNLIKREYSKNKQISVVLDSEGSGNADKFYSKEYKNSTFHPYIKITYHKSNQAPLIVLDVPENKTYHHNNLSLNFSVSDENLKSCWYSIDNLKNISLPNCTNITFSVMEGNHTITIFANDSFGEEGKDSAYFRVETISLPIMIIEPNGTKFSTEISLEYITANGTTCWYNVKYQNSTNIIPNTTLQNCQNMTFKLPGEGKYTISLYINDSSGNQNSTSSNFSVLIPPSTSTSSGGGGGGGSSRTREIIEETNETQETIKEETKTETKREEKEVKATPISGFATFLIEERTNNILKASLFIFLVILIIFIIKKRDKLINKKKEKRI